LVSLLLFFFVIFFQKFKTEKKWDTLTLLSHGLWWCVGVPCQWDRECGKGSRGGMFSVFFSTHRHSKLLWCTGTPESTPSCTLTKHWYPLQHNFCPWIHKKLQYVCVGDSVYRECGKWRRRSVFSFFLWCSARTSAVSVILVENGYSQLIPHPQKHKKQYYKYTCYLEYNWVITLFLLLFF
jgi:hypothetical protein